MNNDVDVYKAFTIVRTKNKIHAFNYTIVQHVSKVKSVVDNVG